MEYRKMKLGEEEKIKQIDATYFIKNAWRKIDGELKLVEINWMDYELPNGLPWHIDHYIEAVENGGYACGCFDNGVLVGYGTLMGKIFGTGSKYLLLDQLFVSKDYRNKNIGKQLFSMCADQAKSLGADKLYICAGSSENTVAFYRKIGCENAIEIDKTLFEEDPNDLQLEFQLK